MESAEMLTTFATVIITTPLLAVLLMYVNNQLRVPGNTFMRAFYVVGLSALLSALIDLARILFINPTQEFIAFDAAHLVIGLLVTYFLYCQFFQATTRQAIKANAFLFFTSIILVLGFSLVLGIIIGVIGT